MEFPRMGIVNTDYNIISLITARELCTARNPCGREHYLSTDNPIEELEKNMKLPYQTPRLPIGESFCCAGMQKKYTIYHAHEKQTSRR